MIHESSSTASTLNRIIEKIEKVEIECEVSSRKAVDEKSTCSKSNEENAVTAGVVAALPTTGPIPMRSTESGSSEVTCRICYDTSPRIPILFPCRCKGTMGAIHLACLERWLEESNRKSCELCGHEFQVERTLRYQALHSIVIWLCLSRQQHQLYVRSLRVDFIRCIIVTPVTIVCSYVCVVAADFYAISNYNFPPARWTTYSLLAMMTILILSYFLWMYMAIQYHQRVWFYWWQKTSIVRVKLPPTPRTNGNKIRTSRNLQLETSV